jgi:hypothetical protein
MDMAEYTHEYSQFPSQILELHNFKDVDDSVASLVNQIKNLQSAGNYAKASELVEANADTLKPYVLSMEYLNMIDEELRNVEIYAKSKKQSVYYQESEPTENVSQYDVWIG